MARMSTILIVGAGVVVVGAAAAYYSYKKGLFQKQTKSVKPMSNLSVKQIEGTLSFGDVVGWFKSLSLDKEKDTPFIALADQVEDMITSYFKSDNIIVYPPLPDGILEDQDKKRLLLGVYDEKSQEVSNAMLLVADSFDAKTLEVLGEEKLVVLS